MLWLALELNLLSFLPIILSTNQIQETEARVKYILTQALGSSLLMVRRLSMYIQTTSTNVIIFILIIAIIIKIGLAPCHIWYPSVISSIAWSSALILTSWQKIAPLSIIIFILIKSSSWIITLLARINALIGGLIGINQSQLRTILAYSSITHLGWITGLISINKPLLAIRYFLIYVIVVSPIFIILNIINVKTLTQINKGIKPWSILSIILPLLLLSLGGLPPLLGFIPKLITIYSITYLPLTIILILGAVINLYYYLNITFSTILRTNKNNFNITSSNINYLITIPRIAALLIIPIIIIYALTILNKS